MKSVADYQACFLIPCYNHGSTVAEVVSSLSVFELPILLVDDGSNQQTKQVLSNVAQQTHVHLITLEQNQGKGGAVMAGIRQAQQLGFSHVIQIDADGQHDLQALPKLLAASKQHPNHLISGQPIYDDSVPKARLYGRYATHIWVWIETLSFTIKDSMCGFRAYPVDLTVEVLNNHKIGTRMDFDIEILVRMYWHGVDIDFVETRVIYPEGGVSHFDALWDNVKISWMHSKLFFGMLPRIPQLLKRNQSRHNKSGAEPNQHWSKRQERGTVLGIKALLAVYSLLGRPIFNLMLKLVMSYYYLTGKQARQASEQYLQHLQSYANRRQITLPNHLSSYNHLLSFGHTMLDKLAAWKGDFSVKNLTIHGQESFQTLAKRKQGVLLLGSHLGNIELCRALGRRHSHIKINALVFTEHAERFNAVMKAINPNSELNLIQVSRLGPDTAILLQQKIEQGEWVVIVGDRTSTSKETRAVWADFLGQPAPFPQGPFMLASVLKAPVYLLFGLRDERSKTPHFNVYFEHFSDNIDLPRKERQAALAQVVQRYADRLEHYTLQAPLQWYNFFNFWTLSKQQHDDSDR
ncbi:MULTISPECIES: glycosyltransferase family 2 protein [Vibrio]|uniref:glycosyltransferase family 2 protein n=1 Tax=Vibrio TaxID=662 RepID=UPI0009C1045E|nr:MULTISPECIES: glycosyltransferase family 2 protein [Vibrio]MCS0351939.1 glycosyltransferase family 2 protein [Vibrio ordalii]AXN03685.1 glycosyltransferase family 2 protein [Vibrio anguillarum]MBT2912919.1 glycosyltransferase family 2 protein [Vibrio anguillarum]MDF9388081.1 glycosyltransferase family 2 protein [Vibrio sp. 1151_11]OQQ12464.1 acyltransferase [Vibrio anguillarum]